MNTDKKVILRVKSSQIINLRLYILCILGFFLIFPIFIFIWKWLEVYFMEYTITNERLTIRSGILSRKSSYLELYRVKDIEYNQPFFLRVFSLCNLTLYTSDKTNSLIIIQGISIEENKIDEIRKYIELQRDKKRVREIDVE